MAASTKPPSLSGSARPESSSRSSSKAELAAYRRSGVGAPEDHGAEHAEDVDGDDVEDHRLRGGGADADRTTGSGVAVVAADQHDHGRHRHPLDQAVDQVGGVLKHPEDQRVAAGGDVSHLVDHSEVARHI